MQVRLLRKGKIYNGIPYEQRSSPGHEPSMGRLPETHPSNFGRLNVVTLTKFSPSKKHTEHDLNKLSSLQAVANKIQEDQVARQRRSAKLACSPRPFVEFRYDSYDSKLRLLSATKHLKWSDIAKRSYGCSVVAVNSTLNGKFPESI